MDALGLFVSAALLTCSAVTQPSSARCPAGWYLNGVRQTGVYECRRAPGGAPDRTVDRLGWYRSRVWCTGGTRPIVVLEDREARTVGCQR